MAGVLREIVAVVVAADSPAGRIAEAINEVSAHLPPPDELRVCSLCSTQCWPCAGFDDAARRVMAGGLRLADLVPLDLHPRLWPRPIPQLPSLAPSRQPELPRGGPYPDTRFDEESRDG